MNGIEKITGQIGADARREIDELLAGARAEAERIAAEAKVSAEAEAGEILRLGREAAQQREDRLARVAALEGRKRLLAAKQELVTQAFDKAMEGLLALEDKDYIALLTDLAVQAARTGHEQVFFAPRDRNRVGKAVVTGANERLGAKGALTLGEETRPIKGGLTLVDGNVETNCSLEALIRFQWETLEPQVAGVLFG